MFTRATRIALLFGVSGAFLGYISQLTLLNNDIFHALSYCREALERGSFPLVDVYAFTPTIAPVVHHEWGTGAIVYLVTVTIGLGAPGLILLKYLLTTGILAGSFACARLRGASTVGIAVLAPLVFPVAWVGFGTMRAQLFTLFFLTLLLLLLELDRRGRRWWIALWPPFFVVWLNVHGGVVAGAGVLALYTLERFATTWFTEKSLVVAIRRVSHLALAILLTVPCLWLNPFGTDYITYLWHALQLERPDILEWSPLWKTYQPLRTLAVFAISVGLVLYSIGRLSWHRMPGLLLVLIATVLAIQHIRNGPVYGIIWLCYVPAFVERTGLGNRLMGLLARHQRPIARVSFALGLLGLAVASSNRWWELKIPTADYREALVYPAGAAEYLAETKFAGNMIVPFNVGAYISWKLYPAVKVNIDSRYEAVYLPGALEESIDFYEGRAGWLASLEKHAPDAVLVPRVCPIDRLLETDCYEGWRRVYIDNAYSLFVRLDKADSLPRVSRIGQQIAANFP